MKRKRGNPTRWDDPERQRRFCEALRLGASIGAACTQAGWSYNAWREWARAAEAAIELGERCKYSDLFDAYEEALQQGERLLAGVIRKAASEDWRAAAWMLERRQSPSWAKVDSLELTGKDGGPIRIAPNVDELQSMTDEDLRRIANREPERA